MDESGILPLIRQLLDGADPNALVNNTPAPACAKAPRIVFATALMRACAADLDSSLLLNRRPSIVSKDGETMLSAAAARVHPGLCAEAPTDG